MPSSENVNISLFAADVRPVGPDEPEEAQISGVEEDSSGSLCQTIVNAGIAVSAEKVAAFLDHNRMLNTRRCKVHITMGLTSCPRKIKHAILDTGASPNLVEKDATDEF